MDLLEELAVFVEVARQGRFASAARQLDKSAPTVTRRMQEFQGRFPVALLRRRVGACELTPEGEACYRRAVHILECIEELLAVGAAPDGLAQTSLTVRCPAGMDSGLLDPWINDFSLANSGLQVQIRTEEPDASAGSGTADVVIGFSSPPSSGTVQLLGMEETVFVASPELGPTLRQPIDFAALAKERFLWLRGQVTQAGWMASRRTDHWQAVALKQLGSSESTHFVLDMVLKGMGVGILPTWLIQSRLRTGELVRVYPKWSIKPHADPQFLRAYAQAPALPGSIALRFLDFLQSCCERAEDAAAQARNEAKVIHWKASRRETAT